MPRIWPPSFSCPPHNPAAVFTQCCGENFRDPSPLPTIKPPAEPIVCRLTYWVNNACSSGDSFWRDGFTVSRHFEISAGTLVSWGSPHATSNNAKQNMENILTARYLYLLFSTVASMSTQYQKGQNWDLFLGLFISPTPSDDHLMLTALAPYSQ